MRTNKNEMKWVTVIEIGPSKTCEQSVNTYWPSLRSPGVTLGLVNTPNEILAVV